MKKILFCASTISHINNFHLPYLEAFKNEGYVVHVAANESKPVDNCDRVVALPFHKRLISLKNIIALFKAYRLLKVQQYEKISTNTTLAGIIVRFAAIFLKERPHIYHIVHGYHFNLNSGIKKYIYLVPEKIASYVSDVVMVMNKEDYSIAQKYKLYRTNLCYIDGIGVNETRFLQVSPVLKNEIKKEMGLKPNAFIFAYAAEFSKRKNQSLLIRAFAKCSLENAKLLLAGDGKQIGKCKKLAMNLGQMNKIKFLGYVKEISKLYSVCDAVVSVSLVEGLPFNIVEAMGCSLPVIASNIKGHHELVEQEVTGLLFKSGNMDELCECMRKLYFADPSLLQRYGSRALAKSRRFSLDNVFPKVLENYHI